MGRSVKRIFRKVAPIASIALPIFMPGLGTAVGAALGAGASAAPIVGNAVIGAGLGAASGGGIKGAAIGGVTGGLAGGGGAAIAQGLGAPAGAVSQGLGSAIAGGVSGAASGGGIEGALKGAALAGAGGYIGSGGKVPGLGSMPSRGPAGYGPMTKGEGLLGRMGSITQASGGAQPMRLGSLLSGGAQILSAGQNEGDLEEMRRMMEAQAARAESQYAPFSQAGQQALAQMQAPSMEALQSDPGYQFRLQQGQQALERSLAAQGLGQSGAALKAAQEYGQGLAGQTYDNFFNRQAQMANIGMSAASGLGNIYSGLGNAQAAELMAQMENRNRLYGGLGSLAGGIFG